MKTFTARYKTVASATIPGLTIEHRPYANGTGVYVIARMGRSWDGYAVTAGRVAWVDCSDRGAGFPANVNHAIALYAQKMADRLVGALLVVDVAEVA